ncbi:GTP-binding protein [Patescibacteria group bacterium]|nr:GTP-binding protein [Patescibacteria group bacterium]MBU0776766.1 GTP-binding protein [Patescibacteria group bacterium]MBU0846339.1 GTP-binding protein [Patescibacteria group bacterium]MBU0922701.1 GTP-binding protein [Patescibacteria group bacterium]MBU1066752.1 GTP-binding protein [Patescibacteria group bacterium]
MEKSRQPIVTVLGHVDHGKTTLLDVIRKTSVAKKETGGITQGIGASMITTKEGKKITFIDTPGHAAFAQMRSRGAKLADIAILVVAADDGVKPQTKEAIDYIKKAEIPFIVAITKIDISSASIESVKGQIETEGILFEGRGGDTPLVLLSSKENKGINELLEMILLVSEVNEIKADEKADLEAVVIETNKDARGSLVSVVVRNGTLSVRDEISTDETGCRIKGLFDKEGKPMKKIFPGEPGLILGFKELPLIGSQVRLATGSKTIKEEKRMGAKPFLVKEEQLPAVFKAESAGALEALLLNLPADAIAVSSGVGPINESDVFFAKSAGAAYIFGFEVKTALSVKKLADTEGVKIETFDIIYKLLERLEELIKEGQSVILGKAEIVDSFPFNNKKVAGCKVISGKISMKDTAVLMRKDSELGKARVVSLRKEKSTIQEAKEGEEFGVILSPQLDFEKGDMLVSVKQ